MKQDQIYQNFKQLILDSDMTLEQVKVMSVQDVVVMVPAAGVKTASFRMNMIGCAAMAKESQLDNLKIESIQNKLTSEEMDVLNIRMNGLTLKKVIVQEELQ